MASLESPQIQVLVDSVQDREERQEVRGEQTPLMGTNKKKNRIGQGLKRCCIKSKSALLILCWEILITLTYGYLIEFGSIAATGVPHLRPDYKHGHGQLQIYATSFFALLAILYLFYPLAGCLADIRCGRYRSVLYSLWIMAWSGLFTCIGSIILLLYTDNILLPKSRSIIPFSIGFGLPTIIGIVAVLSSSITFNANVIQFGMDQLHDSPTEDSVLFIHWFVFTSHLGAAINKCIIPSVLLNFDIIPKISSIAIAHTVPMLALVLLGISIGIAHYKRQWFMIDSGSRNPYKLVYKVIKFTVQHKIPIRRSAFTYCEDELPSRMDLGKEKYGGPFTTEQVEDVKVFLGILSLLLTFGAIFVTEIAVSNVLYKFSRHFQDYFNYRHTIFKRRYRFAFFVDFLSGGFPDSMIICLIPLYLCVLRPFIQRYDPGMLKRIGLGMIIQLLSLLSLFLIDTIGHLHDSTNNKCFLHVILHHYEHLSISIWYVTLPNILNAISSMLFYIAAYEFICAQSPRAMKGLLIGTFFTIKGIFQLISVLIILVPFTTWKIETSFPSCGFVYYLVNIAIAVTGLVTYTWAARRYQYRQRDEPDNIYRYAEEYYDRGHRENNYDYSSDDDNLDVHTVS